MISIKSKIKKKKSIKLLRDLLHYFLIHNKYLIVYYSFIQYYNYIIIFFRSRAAVVPQPPQVVPQVAAAPRHHPHFAPVLRPQPVNYAVGNQAARAATAPTVFYPIYL